MKRSMARPLQLAAGLTILALIASGCGSDGESEGRAEVDTDGLTAATTAYEAAAKPPTSIGLDVPLTDAPKVGHKVFLISNTTPDGLRVVDGIEEATAALGWDLTVLNFELDSPDANSGIEQAIQAKADYIAVMSINASVVQPGIDAAKAAGIPVFPLISPDAPSEEDWRFSNSGGADQFAIGARINANYVISQSKGTANTLLVNVPSNAPLKVYGDAFSDEMSKNCSGCPFAHLDVPYNDVISGALPAKVVSYLRSHPDVDNIVFSVGAFTTGFPAAASAAGLKIGEDGIRVSVFSNSPGNLADLQNGSQAMGLSLGLPWAGWMVVDAMARYGEDMDLKPNWEAVLPQLVLTKDNVPDAETLYDGPEGYEDQFKALWHVN